MYDDSKETRDHLAGLARKAGVIEGGIGRFVDTVRFFNLDPQRLLAEMRNAGLRDVDLFGISRIEQGVRPPKAGDLFPEDETTPSSDEAAREESDGDSNWAGWHGENRVWTVRLYVRSENPVKGSFFDGKEGPEHALVQAMRFQRENTRGQHRPRGPFHAKRKRPGSTDAAAVS